MKKIENVTIPNLLPTTQDYMTYEGSQTQPGCSETVTWIILNKPIYITHKQVELGLYMTLIPMNGEWGSRGPLCKP